MLLNLSYRLFCKNISSFIFVYIRKEETDLQVSICLDIENPWFIDFKRIPLKNQAKYLNKYTKEIFIQVTSENILNFLSKIVHESKNVLLNDRQIFSNDKHPKHHIIKAKDFIEGHKIHYIIIAEENNQLKVNVKQHILEGNNNKEEFMKYIEMKVIEKMK